MDHDDPHFAQTETGRRGERWARAPRRPKPVKAVSAGHRPGTRCRGTALATCQVSTPRPLVREVWRLVHERRRHIGSVLDLGAGDARFAEHGRFDTYVAVEIDPERRPSSRARPNVLYQTLCALDVDGQFDLCIGNPPYIRHQDLTAQWKARAAAKIGREFQIHPDGRSNAYLYFLWCALANTTSTGICALVVPSDWLTRPSATGFRAYLASKLWGVDVYRLGDDQFDDDVHTTACITIIDKSAPAPGTRLHVRAGRDRWKLATRRLTASGYLAYAKERAELYACRGYSTGSQAAFILTDAQRRAARIDQKHCRPCVTSFRHLPTDVVVLDDVTFRKHFVDAGKRCWLLRTEIAPLPPSVRAWLSRVPPTVRENWTCTNRPTWYRFAMPAAPLVLYSSGFHGRGPRILANTMRARAIGAVHGVHGPKSYAHVDALMDYLSAVDFGRQVVTHSGGLRKIDVRQMNGLLAAFYAESR